jgi:branched-chain amino acid transport system ATP-binding protein
VTALLELKKVYKAFGGLMAVNGFDLQVNGGKIHSIIGPNGAGKTTVFNLISGKCHPDQGEIIFKGQDITELKPYQINRKGISRSFQITNFFQGLSVRENIRVACQSKRRGIALFSSVEKLTDVEEMTERIIQALDLWEKRTELAGNLSHGDQRYLEIGITLSNEAELLLLDEPTAGMTPHETKKTVELIQRLKEEHTILLIEHDMEVVMEVSDFITVMHQGEKLAWGLPENVRTNTKVMDAYFGGEL